MSISSNLTKLTTDITNAYTSIENKGGTIPANKNTNNLPTAIDSIEVIEQATAEGESLSLANTKAMPYSDYVVEGKSEQEGTPSPSNPSEIHSVADDVNLFDEETELITYGYISSYEYSNGIYTIIPTGTGNPQIRLKFILPAGTYTLNSEAYLSIATILRNNNGLLNNFQAEYQNQTFTTTETSAELVFNWTNPNNTSPITLDLRTLKIQKGTVATPYSPYNQGTVTIKQRGKNLLNVTATSRTYNNTLIVTVNNDKSITFNGMNSSNEPLYFRLAPNFDLQAGTYTLSNKNSNVGENSVIFYDDGGNFEPRSNIVTKTFSNIVTVKPYIKISIGATFDNFTIYPMIEQNLTATDYEPYQANDHTLQTEPLRSLPNGVKDTIEADGIHRRVGRVVLDGSESGWYKQDNTSYSQDYLRFTISITDKIDAINPNSQKDNILSDKFTNKILDNNATRQSNSITGQYSTNLINIFIAQSIIIGNDVNSFKTWLSTHNTEVLYELAEEIIEPLTQNQATTMLDIIKTGSYEGTTNIYTDEDVKPTIGVGYYKKS